MDRDQPASPAARRSRERAAGPRGRWWCADRGGGDPVRARPRHHRRRPDADGGPQLADDAGRNPPALPPAPADQPPRAGRPHDRRPAVQLRKQGHGRAVRGRQELSVQRRRPRHRSPARRCHPAHRPRRPGRAERARRQLAGDRAAPDGGHSRCERRGRHRGRRTDAVRGGLAGQSRRGRRAEPASAPLPETASGLQGAGASPSLGDSLPGAAATAPSSVSPAPAAAPPRTAGVPGAFVPAVSTSPEKATPLLVLLFVAAGLGGAVLWLYAGRHRADAAVSG